METHSAEDKFKLESNLKNLKENVIDNLTLEWFSIQEEKDIETVNDLYKDVEELFWYVDKKKQEKVR